MVFSCMFFLSPFLYLAVGEQFANKIRAKWKCIDINTRKIVKVHNKECNSYFSGKIPILAITRNPNLRAALAILLLLLYKEKNLNDSAIYLNGSAIFWK